MQHDELDKTKTAEIALILVFRGETEIERRAFAIKQTIAIGRDPFTDIILEDPTVSRLHVELRREGDDLVLHDKSSNGTMVNGRSVTRHVVNDRDVISLGRFTLIVELHSDSKSSLYAEAHAEGWTMDDDRTMRSDEAPARPIPRLPPKRAG